MKLSCVVGVALALFASSWCFATEEQGMTTEEREVASDSRGLTSNSGDQGMTTEELSMAARERGVHALDRSQFGIVFGGTSVSSKRRNYSLLRSGDKGFDGLLRITSNIHIEVGYRQGEAEILDDKGADAGAAPRECGAPQDEGLPIVQCLWRYDYEFTTGGTREFDLQQVGLRVSTYPQFGTVPMRLSMSAGTTEDTVVDDTWLNLSGCFQLAYYLGGFYNPDTVYYWAQCYDPMPEFLDLGFIQDEVTTKSTYFSPSMSALFDGRFEPELALMFVEDRDMTFSLGVTVHLRDWMRAKFSLKSASGDQRETSVRVSLAL